MRQVHRVGEKTFIDFSGKRPRIVDRHTGEERPVEACAFMGVSSTPGCAAYSAEVEHGFRGSPVRAWPAAVTDDSDTAAITINVRVRSRLPHGILLRLGGDVARSSEGYRP